MKGIDEWNRRKEQKKSQEERLGRKVKQNGIAEKLVFISNKKPVFIRAVNCIYGKPHTIDER